MAHATSPSATVAVAHDKQFSLNWKTTLALVVTIILWGSAFVGIRAALNSYGPGELALFRYLVASVALGGIIFAGKSRLPAKDLPRLFAAGFMGIGLYNLLLNAGELKVTAASASLMVNVGPVFSAILAILFLHERLNVAGWFGMFFSFFGAATIVAAEGGGVRWQPAALLVLAAALAQSIYFVITKPLLRTHSALIVTTVAVWCGTIALLPYLLTLPNEIKHASHAATMAVLYLAIFPGAIGYACWSYVLARFPVSSTTTYLYFVPLATGLIGWFWLGEVPPGLTVLGGALTLFGVVLVNRYGREPH